MSMQQGPNLPGVYTGYYPPQYGQYNTQFQGNIETIGWKWWDTQTFTSGVTTSLTQFFNVRGTTDLSNMEVAFQLAAPKAFLIRAIRFFVKQRPQTVTTVANGAAQVGALDDIAQLINTGVFQLTIGNKVYNLEPLWCLTAGGGAWGLLQTGSTVSVSYAQNGIPDPRAVNTLSKPLFIGPQINFTAQITWPAVITTANGNPSICILLDGDLLRPVQ
jgi:hypothetical protein